MLFDWNNRSYKSRNKQKLEEEKLKCREVTNFSINFIRALIGSKGIKKRNPSLLATFRSLLKQPHRTPLPSPATAPPTHTSSGVNLCPAPSCARRPPACCADWRTYTVFPWIPSAASSAQGHHQRSSASVHRRCPSSLRQPASAALTSLAPPPDACWSLSRSNQPLCTTRARLLPSPRWRSRFENWFLDLLLIACRQWIERINNNGWGIYSSSG